MARRTKRSGLHRFATVSVAFFVVACAGQDTLAPVESDLSLADRLFAVGYRDISDIYIDDVTVSELALAGLRSE